MYMITFTSTSGATTRHQLHLEVVDLGVTMDKKLRFSSHVATICCKAHRRANLILKCFHSKDASSLLSAFKAYVRPILEYSCVVWNPFL